MYDVKRRPPLPHAGSPKPLGKFSLPFTKALALSASFEGRLRGGKFRFQAGIG